MKKTTIPLSLAITGLAGATTYFALENLHLQELLKKQSEVIKSQRNLIIEDKNLIEKQKALINEQIDIITKQSDVIESQKNTIEQMMRNRVLSKNFVNVSLISICSARRYISMNKDTITLISITNRWRLCK